LGVVVVVYKVCKAVTVQVQRSWPGSGVPCGTGQCRGHCLRGLFLLGLEGLLAIAPYHDDGQEGADNGGEEDDEDDGDANGPDTGQEERVQQVVLVDKGLGGSVWERGEREEGPTMKSVQME
jgi:hypothetical protein